MKTSYITSKDYRRLYSLIQSGHRIVCFVQGKRLEHPNVALYSGSTKYRTAWELSARGICYTEHNPTTETMDNFILSCESKGVEYIDIEK